MTIGEDSAPAGDDALVGWLHAGLDDLVAAVRETPPDTDFWRFMRDAPNSVTFWARRQAHETAIHRVDADIAAGAASPAFAPDVAADGLDELLVGFGGRMRSPIAPERRLLVDAVERAGGGSSSSVRQASPPGPPRRPTLRRTSMSRSPALRTGCTASCGTGPMPPAPASP